MNSFLIPFNLPTLNEYISAERSNRFIAAKIKKDTTNQIAFFCKNLALEKCQHDLKITWTTKTARCDSDNIFFATKFILDAVVDTGKLRGDGYKHIRNISHIRELGDKDTILVTFIPVFQEKSKKSTSKNA